MSQPAGPSIPLVACPQCASTLIYARDVAGTGSNVVLARRCPECEHRDSVTTTVMAAAAWFGRDARLAARLSTAIDGVSAARSLAASATTTSPSKTKARRYGRQSRTGY